MTLSPLTVACPQCSSKDIVYSCKPECCFNHVCNNCYTTFELATTKMGETCEEFSSPPETDPTGATAPCARCGEVRVFAIAGSDASRLVCLDCRALLALEITNVTPA
jgi:hypothetical protein